MDLAAESRVKLARNNKVPRLGGTDAPRFPWSDFFLFFPKSSIMTFDLADRFILSLLADFRLTLYSRKKLAHLLALMLKLTIICREYIPKRISRYFRYLLDYLCSYLKKNISLIKIISDI